jgi:hypothetical protein
MLLIFIISESGTLQNFDSQSFRHLMTGRKLGPEGMSESDSQ